MDKKSPITNNHWSSEAQRAKGWQPTEKTKVIVGLSGGVDSSVAAKLLVDQGYEVVGVFMKNWEDGTEHCSALEDMKDAEQVAKKMGIPFYTYDFSRQYWEEVFEYFIRENKAGRTPNPDILCNRYIKFGVFLDKAQELEADFIATGHYAKRVLNNASGEYELHIPEDKEKDQTYFLHALTQDQLSKALFPLENMQKNQVRSIAEEYGFLNATKKDSTGICFIGERNYSEFLQKYVSKNPGNIVTPEGQVIGKHIGLSFYTIGQRRELGIGGVTGAEEKPWFVIEKDFESNNLVVSQDENLLLKSELMATDLTWIGGVPPAEVFECQARIRYRQGLVACKIALMERKQTQGLEIGDQGTKKRGVDLISNVRHPVHAKAHFKEPQRAVAPGQSVVFYQGDNCLGGGVIQ